MSDLVTTDPPPAAQPAATRRSTTREIAQMIDLGWRVAALHALRPTTMKPLTDAERGLLPNRRSLQTPDRLELEVNAIAGVASRAGVPIGDKELRALLALAVTADSSARAEQEFRDLVAVRHVDFAKRLWAADEPQGKAYELGNFLSDTWNPLAVPGADKRSELSTVFEAERVGRMKVLLDDLQARIDPVAVHAVSHQLQQWCDGIPDVLQRSGRVEAKLDFDLLRNQTVIWRQMLTGDKEPEAWIDHAGRSQVRTEVSRQMWRRYRVVLGVTLPLLAAIGAGLASYYDGHEDTVRAVVTGALTVLGALGITRASMIGALRQGVMSWGDLMWSRALATVVCRETSLFVAFTGPGRRDPSRYRTNSTSTRSPASSDSRSSGTNA